MSSEAMGAPASLSRINFDSLITTISSCILAIVLYLCGLLGDLFFDHGQSTAYDPGLDHLQHGQVHAVVMFYVEMRTAPAAPGSGPLQGQAKNFFPLVCGF